MLADGRAAHNPSPTWKVFFLFMFPKIIHTKSYFSTLDLLRKFVNHSCHNVNEFRAK
jgi:hypothetical protein